MRILICGIPAAHSLVMQQDEAARKRNVTKALRRPRLAALFAVMVILAGLEALGAPAAVAAGYVPISGSGSTWSSNALDQWRRNVASLYGITVNYSPNGSTSGRNDFRDGQVDFAVSEIPYGLTDGGLYDSPPTQKFGYMPIVAGGTSFMYNLKIGGKRVTNLRLSGDTLAKIFTQQITNWSDPAIKADNPQLTLPARQIVPVVYSNGSGTAAQFTTWLADQYPDQWDAYCHRVGRNITPCGFTSFYPHDNNMVAKAQSQGVAGFVAQDSSEGAITFVEYSYARNAEFPVAKVLNKAGYYVEPTAGSVAVALLQAQIKPDLTQKLHNVYVDTDHRAYPLSSYSYMILPKDTSATNPVSHFNLQKGRTFYDFASYFLCEGQQQADTLGYSPLPIDLVQAGVDQINQVPGADQATLKLDRNNLAHCHNPTIAPDGGNLVAETAPQPQPCDRPGPTQCATGTGGAIGPTPNNPSGGNGQNNGNGSTSNNGPTGNNGSTGNNGGNTAGNNPGGDANGTLADGTTPGGRASTTIDPVTGDVIDNGASLGNTNSSGAVAVPVSVDSADDRRQTVLGVLAVVLLLGLVLGPPLVARRMRNRAVPPGGLEQ